MRLDGSPVAVPDAHHQVPIGAAVTVEARHKGAHLEKPAGPLLVGQDGVVVAYEEVPELVVESPTHPVGVSSVTVCPSVIGASPPR